jgi:hypothetical protein
VNIDPEDILAINIKPSLEQWVDPGFKVLTEFQMVKTQTCN